MQKTASPLLLKNQVCMITGAAGLLGQEFSRACATAGATVVMVDVNAAKGEKLAAALRKKTKNSRIVFYSCDCTSATAIRKLKNAIIKKFKRIDALVNSAYPRNKQYGRAFERVTYKDFCENVNLHLGGYFLTSQIVAKVMKKQGHGNIIFMGSIYGVAAPRFEIYAGTPMTMPVEYAAIKGGVVMLAKYLASYLGKYTIRVNCISPGGIEDNQPASFVKKYSAKVLLGKRLARPDDISGVLTFLLSDAAKYLTGQNIVVDGGWSL